MKLITELNIGDYETGDDNPQIEYDAPLYEQLVLGYKITWASYDWYVVHKTDTEAYLIRDKPSKSDWNSLNQNCANFSASLTDNQRACLKSITAGSTSGSVFIATKAQLEGDFSYFTDSSKRLVFSTSTGYYWTSTEYDSTYAWMVDTRHDDPGAFTYHGYGAEHVKKTSTIDYHPAVCIDLSIYK